MPRRSTFCRVSLSVAGVLAASALTAQELPLTFEPITVTAQKRDQPLHRVPITLTTWSGAEMEALGLTRYEDLAPLVPGLFVSAETPLQPSINLRGIGSNDIDSRQAPRISVFQDGVAISRTAGSVVELFDLERVEVLKGPQGTLFGRDAGSGAISLVSRKPRPERTAALTAGLGNLGRRHLAGVVNTPLGSDRLLGRLAFTSETRDGTTANLADGSDLNSRETLALRGALRWLPRDGTTIDLLVNFQRDTPGGVGFKSIVIPPSGDDLSPFTAAELSRGARLGLDRTVWGATLQATLPLAPRWKLTSLTAAREFDAQEELDADGSRLFLIEPGVRNRGHLLSEELRFGYGEEGDRLTGFIGVAVSRERTSQVNTVRTDERVAWPFLADAFRDGLRAAGIPDALAFGAVPVMERFSPQSALPAGFALFAAVPPLAPLAASANAPLKSLHEDINRNSLDFDAAEIFTDGTWRVTSALELTAGLRFSREQQATTYRAVPSASPSNLGFLFGAGPNFAFAPTDGELRLNDTSHAWVGRLAARYEISPHLNTYAVLSRGRRPRALIISASGIDRSAEESVLNAELGLKGRTPSGRFEWSAAIFRYRYRHFQTYVQDPANLARFIVADAGRATGQGGEFTARARLHRHLGAFVTYGYTDVTFDATGEGGAPQLYAGSRPRLTSRHTAALGFTAEFASARRGRWAFSPRWQYRSAHFFEDNNSLFGGTLRQSAFALVHVQTAWSSPSRRWDVSAYIRNVFDREYLVDFGNIGGLFGIPTTVRGEPRLLGVDVTRHF